MKIVMMKSANVLGLTATVIMTASIASTAAGCADKKPAATPISETTATTGAPVMKQASESIAVDEDLARLCKLQARIPDAAPKFDFDRSELLPGDRELLTKIATCLTTGPLKGRSLQLVGRTDSRGEPQYNMSLGANRASTVGTFLVDHGMHKSKTELTSRGELDAVGVDEAGFQTDRRVDVVLIKK